MKKIKPRKSAIEYAISLFGWGLMPAHLYHTTVFKSIPGLSLHQSNWVFWGLWILVLTAGLLLTPKRQRTDFSVFATVNTPVGIYLILSFFPLYRRTILFALALIGLALTAYTILVLMVNTEAIRTGKLRGKMKRFLIGFFHRSRMILCTGLSLIFLVIYVNFFFDAPLMESTVAVTDPKVNNQKIADNIDTVLLLQEDIWATLSPQQRLDVLQTVANIEATYLGLPHELNVTVMVLEPHVIGHYADSTHTIAISADYLTESNAYLMLKTVAHEAYHAYERRLVDLYDQADPQQQNLLFFNRIEEYEYNFANYIEGSDDPEGYAAQAIEADSVSYAIHAASDYYEAIEKHRNADT